MCITVIRSANPSRSSGSLWILRIRQILQIPLIRQIEARIGLHNIAYVVSVHRSNLRSRCVQRTVSLSGWFAC